MKSEPLLNSAEASGKQSLALGLNPACVGKFYVKFDTQVMADVRVGRITVTDHVQSAIKFFRVLSVSVIYVEAAERLKLKTYRQLLRNVDKFLQAVEVLAPGLDTVSIMSGWAHANRDLVASLPSPKPTQKMPSLERARAAAISCFLSTSFVELQGKAITVGLEAEFEDSVALIRTFLRRNDKYLSTRLEVLGKMYDSGKLTVAQAANVLGLETSQARELILDRSPKGFAWVETLYAFVSNDQADAALDLLFERIDDLLVGGKFQQCNEFLQTLDIDRLDTNLKIGVLTVTLPARRELPARAKVLSKIHESLMKTDAHRVDRLLSGL